MEQERTMRLLENAIYQADLSTVCNLDLPWEELDGRSILISGATGMIGSTLIDVLMMRNRSLEEACGVSADTGRAAGQGQAEAVTVRGVNCLEDARAGKECGVSMRGCRIIALGRSEEKAKSRFQEYWEDPRFVFVRCDINDRESLEHGCVEAGICGLQYETGVCRVQDEAGFTGSQGEAGVGDMKEEANACSSQYEFGKTAADTIDYVFHAASNTHPVAYANDPIGTVVTNIIGLDNLLHSATEHGCRRFLFASSNEIYGENRGDTELFDEQYCGYIDCNTLRAGYPESKRAGEALCQAYIRQKGLDVVIPRFTRSFGPSLLATDTKALSQFIRKGVAREDIVLKSAGTQFFSYTYVCDAVSGLLYCLLKGSCGEAYNIADVNCDITLRDLAQTIADSVGTKVVFDLPDAVEAAGYSKATKARLDSTKLQRLGWKAQFDMKTALEHTIKVMRMLAE